MSEPIRTIREYYDVCESDYSVFMDVKKNLAMHFGYWDKSVKNFSEAMKKINSILAGTARIQKNHVVLDAGCGVGGSALFLSETIGCTVFGITMSERQARHAAVNASRCRSCSSTFFLGADFTQTPFPDSIFDVVWAVESVCHAHDTGIFIAECARLLKKGGVFIMADAFATQQTFPAAYQELQNKWLKGWCVESLWTKDQCQLQLYDRGFTNVSITDVTSHIERTSKILYLYSLPSLFLGTIARYVGLMSRVRLANIRSAYYQYKAMKLELWKYGILYAEKG